MEIKVLGGGCSNCKKLLERVQQAVQETAIKADVLYITDLQAIMESGLLRTPGLIIDGKVASAGRVPNVAEIKAMILSHPQ